MIITCLSNLKRERVTKISTSKEHVSDGVIIMDNAATISVFRDASLFSEWRSMEPICIDGVEEGSDGVRTSSGGVTEFGEAYYTNKVIGNILSFAKCVDSMYRVKYAEDKDQFEIQPVRGGKVYIFARDKDSNLYLCNVSRRARVATNTVRDQMKMYTRREVAQAEKARAYQKRIAVITEEDMIKMLAKGKVRNIDVNAEDVARGLKIWGQDLASLKGKTTAHKAPVVVPEYIDSKKLLARKAQVLYVDIMFVNGRAYLIGVFKTLDYVEVKKLRDKSNKELERALKVILRYVQRKGFEVTVIRSDGESAIESEYLRQHIDIPIDTSGGEHVPIIERKIRMVKERIRGVLNTLPFTLTEQLEEWLIQNLIYFINYVPMRTSVEYTSAREKLTGKVLDAKTDLKHQFGDYVQVGNQVTNNSMEERTRGALALMPAGNLEGSWYYMLLGTWKPIKRNWAKELPMPDVVIDYINKKASEESEKRASKTAQNENIRMGLWRGGQVRDIEEFAEEEEEAEDLQEEIIDVEVFEPREVELEVNIAVEEEVDSVDVEEEVNAKVSEDAAVIDDEAAIEVEDVYEDPVVEDEVANEVTEEASGAPDDIESENEDNMRAEGETEEPVHRGESSNAVPRYNLRERKLGSGMWRGAAVTRIDRWKREFGLNMTTKQAIDKLGYVAIKSIVQEMLQHVDKGTFRGVKFEDLSEEEVMLIISSKTFLKDKYLADGEFEKLKTRLVAGGHMQDRNIYDDSSSPTVSTTSLFIVAAIAAREKRAVATVDFPGAYLHSDMPADKPVYMKLNKFETQVMCIIDPEFERFVLPDGKSVVKLQKALYGCVESARLWYEKIAADMEAMGFVRNQYDKCVFNRGAIGKQTTVVLHVDDMKVTAPDEKAIDDFLKELEGRYQSLSIKRGRILNYLGMTFDYTVQGKVKVTMKGYTDDLLMELEEIIEGVSATPAASDLFKINEASERLDKGGKEFYHTFTAKLLYLAKRVRPDILTVVSFLCKRVQEPTVEDMKKLKKVIKYIRHTRDLGIILEADKMLAVLAYVDSSYGVHSDLRSHTGVVIGLGRGPVYAKSSTQKINTKSSTESELVGLSDSTNQVIWCRNFILDQGYSVDAAKVYQDNQSTIAMVKNGKSTSDKTKHIAVRFYFVADRVKSGEISIEYMNTGDMIADILTKPLQGGIFRRLRKLLLNWDEEVIEDEETCS